MLQGFYKDFSKKHIYLLDSKRNPIVCVTNMVCNLSHVNLFNGTGDMSFDIYYNKDTADIYNNFLIPNITHFRFQDYGEYVIDTNGISENNQGEVRYKTVTLKDEEFKLDKRQITLPPTTSSYFVGKLWDSNSSVKSVMREIFNKVPSWSIGDIDSEITTNPLSFKDISKQNILKFIYENIEQSFDCIPFFDSLNRTISFKKTKNAVRDSGIVATFSNLIDLIVKESLGDVFCTSMYTEGGNLDIRRVNPDGANYVYYYEKFYDKMSDTLRSNMQQWLGSIETNEETYRMAFAEWSEAQTNYEVLNAQYEALLPMNTQLSQAWALAISVYGEDSTEAQVAEDNYWSWLNSSGFSGLYDKVASAQTLANKKKAVLDGINAQCKKSNFLTSTDLIELDQFETEGSYKQEAFAYINGMTEAQKGEVSQILKDYAEEEIARCNAPRYTYTVSLSNFCTMEGCENFAEDLDVGVYITLYDDITRESVKLIVVKIEWDNENQDLKLTFSDRMTGHEKFPTLNEYLNNVYKTMDDIEKTNAKIDEISDSINTTNTKLSSLKTSVDTLYENMGASSFNIETYTSPNLQTTSKNPIGAINEVFQCTTDAFNLFATSIQSKGGTVNKVGANYTKTEINTGILSIAGGGGSTTLNGIAGCIPEIVGKLFDEIYKAELVAWGEWQTVSHSGETITKDDGSVVTRQLTLNVVKYLFDSMYSLAGMTRTKEPFIPTSGNQVGSTVLEYRRNDGPYMWVQTKCDKYGIVTDTIWQYPEKGDYSADMGHGSQSGEIRNDGSGNYYFRYREPLASVSNCNLIQVENATYDATRGSFDLNGRVYCKVARYDSWTYNQESKYSHNISFSNVPSSIFSNGMCVIQGELIVDGLTCENAIGTLSNVLTRNNVYKLLHESGSIKYVLGLGSNYGILL